MAEHRVNVLIIDEDAAFLEEAVAELSGHFTVYTSATGGDGLKLCAQLRPQVVILDAGISDIPFPDLLDYLKGLDGAVLRIATSYNYSAIEKVVQAIDTAHIHKYFRKPVNYSDLVESINARTVHYQVGRGMQRGADSSPAYERLHNIVDKAKEVEKLRQQLESQMAKIRDVEAESFNKMKDALGEVDVFRKKVADKEALISSLQTKSLELKELKKRDIDLVERERAALRQELKGLQDEHEKLLREKDELSHVKSDNETLRKEIEKLSGENSDLQVSVARERKTMIEEMAQQRRTVEEELARKKDEAERVVEVQKERNNAELQKVHDAFEEEKQSAIQEIEGFKAEFEESRKARLAEIEADRKRVEEELARKKDEAERAIELQKERNKAELQKVYDALEEEKQSAAREIEKLKAEFDADRTAKLAEIEADRKRVEQELAEIEADRKRVGEELARKKDQAERAIELQKERNKAELQALQDAFKEEQQRAAWFEIDRLKAELEADRQAKLAEIEADRKRVEEEIVEIRARMIEEKKQLEKSAQEQREKAEADVQRVRESAAKEREKLTRELEVTLTEMKKTAAAEVKELKASATRELDRLKAAVEKKERERSEVMIQNKRMTGETEERLKLAEDRIKALESEIEKKINEKDLILREMESVRADFTVAVQSREALLAELAELSNRPK